MNTSAIAVTIGRVLKWAPAVIFIVLIATFASLSPRFLTVQNLVPAHGTHPSVIQTKQ